MEWLLTSIKPKFLPFAVIYRYMTITRPVVNLSFKLLSDVRTDADEIPILFFHDLLSSKKQWEGIGKTILTLTKRPVIAVDLRNHGDSPHSYSHRYFSMAKDILRLLNKLSVKKASLIGHSMGGMASMSVALMAPEKVAGVLIVDISPVSTSPMMAEFFPQVLATMKEVDFVGFRKVRKAKKAAKKKLKNVVNDDIILQDILTNVNILRTGTIGWKCNLDVLHSNVYEIAQFPKEFLKGKQYMGPALFIGGQRSECLPPDDLPGIREIFPQAVITYVPGAGHNVHVDDPKTFLEFAIAFVRTNE